MSNALFAEITRQTLNELALHGVTGWSVRKMRGTSSLGKCSYKERAIYYNVNLLALQSEDTIVQTMAHEIAHVLAPFDKHGSEWKKWVVRLGGIPKYSVSSQDLVLDDSLYKYIGYCSQGHKFTFQRVTTRVNICNKCGKGTPYHLSIIAFYEDGTLVSEDRFPARYRSELAYIRKHGAIWYEQ